MHPFFYDLPDARIAQRPVHPPESAKLLVYNPKNATPVDATFANIGTFLRAGDALVFNNSKVLPARLFGAFRGGGEVELLLMKRISDGLWECMGRPLKKFKPDTVITLTDTLQATVKERIGEKAALIQFQTTQEGSIDAAILSHGCMPIPPYIRRGHGDAEDVTDYQSIFARVDGSVAAPTASLHFSDTLVAELKEMGLHFFEVTLHVGAASFLAVWEPDRGDTIQSPGVEYYVHSSSLPRELEHVREQGGRVIAVGTTVTRALESMYRSPQSQDGELCHTDLFITPGYKFQSLDGLVTNFHQPGTTHLLLVESILGKEALTLCYEHALNNEYRFLSYGDGCLFWR